MVWAVAAGSSRFVDSVAARMAEEFKIESRTDSALKVRHVATGHRFMFRVLEPSRGRRILRGTAADRAAKAYERAARAFAEQEARKVGLID
jgi:hypothetical protein